MPTFRLLISSFIAFCLGGLGQLATAQDPLTAVRPYDGIQAGLEAFRLAEEQRQGAVLQQLSMNDQLRFGNGYAPNFGNSIYYGYMSPQALALYGFWGPPDTGWTGFQPGPFLGGGLWGAGARYQAARQPIGQAQIQTGPNRWESHPVYDPPLTMYGPSPPVDSLLLDRTPYATPPAIVPPAAIAPAGMPSEAVPPPPPPAVFPTPSRDI
jgi:hypothetical protein